MFFFILVQRIPQIRRKPAALIVCACFCGIVFLSLDNYGITLDEGVYFHVGNSYFRWWQNPSLTNIDTYWKINSEHPPLPKLLGGITTYLFHEKLNLRNTISSFRLATLIFVFFSTYFLFLFLQELIDFKIALIATAFFFFLPRVFFHSHLGAMDYPITCLWLMVIYTYWKGVRDRKWIIVSSILLGFALLTKVNAFLIYIPLLFYWLLFHSGELKSFIQKKSGAKCPQGFKLSSIHDDINEHKASHSRETCPREGGERNPGLSLRKQGTISKIVDSPVSSTGQAGQARNDKLLSTYVLLYKIIPLLIIPPIIFIAFWPWLWKDTFQRVTDYFSFHMHHAVVYVYYLGTQHPIAPWHYPWVLTFVTVPLITLAPFFIGLIYILFHPNKTSIFLLFNALFPLILISFPSVPKYDGVRLFLPAFPFICMIAGMGIQQIFLFAQKFKFARLFYFVFVGLFVLTVYSSIVKIHPYQSSYFNELVGGVDGAAKKGFELEYWGNAYIGALRWMNEHADKTFWVYMADLEPKTLWGFDLFKKDGILNESVKFGNKNNSDYLVLLIRPGFFNEEMWQYYKYKEPVFSVKLSQTNLANIYKLK